MNGQFEARFVHPESRQVETARFDIVPPLEQAQKVCGLFREFLAGRPTQFRAAIPFLNRGDMELEWAAAEGGAAFATFYESKTPAALAVVAANQYSESGAGLIEGFKNEVLKPMLGGMTKTEEAGLETASADPLLLAVILPGKPELTPALQLMLTSMAAVFISTWLDQAAKATE